MKDGFTLLEVLLSVALIAVLAGISLPVSQQFQQRSDLRTTATVIVENMRRAQILAQASDEDSSWGISIDPGDSDTIVVFRGATFATRDATSDEVTGMSNTITTSGTSEYVFAKTTGLPSDTGTITLTNTTGGTIAIQINAKGTITY